MGKKKRKGRVKEKEEKGVEEKGGKENGMEEGEE